MNELLTEILKAFLLIFLFFAGCYLFFWWVACQLARVVRAVRDGEIEQ